VIAPRWPRATLAFALAAASCGGPPPPAPQSGGAAPPLPAKRRADIPDDCEQEPGKPPPEPLRVPYTGVAKAARCQREVYTIMGGVTHFLGMECKQCHQEPDYAADTHNKQIANWMARELVPRLKRRSADPSGSRDVWCQDCHAGKPKLLGNPRRRDLAVEWMTTHLVEDFDRASGTPPKCKDCHGGDLGSPEFRSKIILADFGGVSLPEPPAPPPTALEPAPAPAPSAAPSPVPDFGKR